MNKGDIILLKSFYENIILNEENESEYPPLEKFDKNMYNTAELVPVEYLNTIKEFDRGNRFSSWDFKNFEEMEDEIFKNGMKYPLYVGYSVPDKMVLLVEGNHRLFLANKLNIKYLPVVVVRQMYKFMGDQKEKAKEVVGYKKGENVHVPSNMKPSEIGIPSIPMP
jgi:hypothetical protein